MQCIKFSKYFLAILIAVSFMIFNNAIAQLQGSDAFTGPVKRDVLPVNLPKTNFIFNPTIQTTPSSPTSPNGIYTITDGQDIRVFPSANVQAEVHISINKINPNNLVASANTYLNTYNQGYYYSLDGGNTWQGADQLQNNPGLLFGDPSTAFSADGRGHISTIDPAGGYLTQNSTNGGVTWSNLINGTNQANFDKEMIAADNLNTSPFANNVYCAWSILQSNVGPYFVNFNRSINNGAAFTAPITLKPNNGMGQGANVQTGPNGEVYVCWADYDVDATNKVIYPSHGLGFCSSSNGGVNFTPYQRVLNYTGIRVSSAPNPLFNNIGVNDFPSMAVDKSNGPHRGRIYVVLPIKENGKAVVGFTFSDNQGGTWSALTTISIPTGRQNFFPWITVDDCTGDVWATYYSFDTPSGFTTNTYVTHSIDGGATWESQRVSDVSHITAPINNAIFRTGYAGDYIGITAFGGKAYPIWMDNRNGTWQLYCSPVTSNLNTCSISGDNIVCATSNNYTITNLPVGATVTWSASPSNVVTINSPNSSQTTLTKINNGFITLTATIANICGGNNIVINRQIGVGYTQILNIGYPSSTVAPDELIPMQIFIAPDSLVIGNQKLVIKRTGGGYSNTLYTGGDGAVEFSFPITGTYTIKVYTYNDCGWSTNYYPLVFFCTNDDMFMLSPNPANTALTVKLSDETVQAGNEKSNAIGIKEIQLTDKMGNVLKRYVYSGTDKQVTMDVSALKADIYYIRVFNGKQWQGKSFIKQ